MVPVVRHGYLYFPPTRELAEQTHVAFSSLGRQTGFRSQPVYGGVSQIPQVKALRAGAEIIVACPGRLLDLMGQRQVNLSGIEVLVLDEADQMFDMGFLPSIRQIVGALPKGRQTLLFSATMPKEIRSLANEMLQNPVTVELGASKPVETVAHAVYPVDGTQKSELLLKLIYDLKTTQVLVFTRTKHRAKKVAEHLQKAGISAASLQGNLSQSQRQVAMSGFRSGRVKVLVATDIASRGIDVLQISHVINYDLPDTAEGYTHRIGRTGRMTRAGIALSLVTHEDTHMLRTIEQLLGAPLERRKLEGFVPAILPVEKPAYKPQSGGQGNSSAGMRRRWNDRPRTFQPSHSTR